MTSRPGRSSTPLAPAPTRWCLRCVEEYRDPCRTCATCGSNLLEWGQVREYWDEGDIDMLETLTLEASTAVENAWRALTAVTDAHTAQEEAELGIEDGD